MSDPSDSITCDVHGKSIATFVCCHLRCGVACGYHTGWDPENPEDQRPDAWCSACEEAYDREGGWNDVSMAFADIVMLCSGCYDEAKQRNEEPPEPLDADIGRLDEATSESLVRAACQWTSEVQALARDQWNFHSYGRWSWAEEEGAFAFEDEKLGKLTARVRVAGTYSIKKKTWMWGWANGDLHEAATQDISRLKVFGEARGFAAMTNAVREASIEDAWHFASLAAYLLEAGLVYRVQMGQVYVFMLLDELAEAS